MTFWDLQNNTITMDVATKSFRHLASTLYESAAKEINPNSEYKDKLQKKEFVAHTVQLDGKENFYAETFLPIIDTLNTHLKQRSESYKEINERIAKNWQISGKINTESP
ncbi:zinc finger MYM-type protein 1-like, partial [Aphis craccivora]